MIYGVKYKNEKIITQTLKRFLIKSLLKHNINSC